MAGHRFGELGELGLYLVIYGFSELGELSFNSTKTSTVGHGSNESTNLL
jgi:hypothetical protein